MKNERSYSAKSILIALGKSALYLLFFLAVQFFVVVIYGIVVATNAAINGETDLVRGGHRRSPINSLAECQHLR